MAEEPWRRLMFWATAARKNCSRTNFSLPQAQTTQPDLILEFREQGAAFAVATFGVELTISPSWAYCIDIGCKNSGSVSAAMNMAGSFGAFASANAFPWLYRLTGDSGTYFRIAAGLNALAILCWFSMRSNHSLEPAQALENAAFKPPTDLR